MEKLFSKKITKSSSSSVTQSFLDVAEIKEDVIVLKNGSLRAILAVSSINYDLKSSDEQNALITHYQNFINSLDFPLQIVINSRKLNMEKYLKFLEDHEKKQPNELLRFQIAEYQNFIKQLISVSNIMEKNFYVVVPFSPVEDEKKGFFKKLFTIFNPRKGIIEKIETFETYRNQLFQRVDHITTGLGGTGMRVDYLKTQELIEILYYSYNPDIFNITDIADVNKLDMKN